MPSEGGIGRELGGTKIAAHRFVVSSGGARQVDNVVIFASG